LHVGMSSDGEERRGGRREEHVEYDCGVMEERGERGVGSGGEERGKGCRVRGEERGAAK
jgi:hypothetical protein